MLATTSSLDLVDTEKIHKLLCEIAKAHKGIPDTSQNTKHVKGYISVEVLASALNIQIKFFHRKYNAWLRERPLDRVFYTDKNVNFLHVQNVREMLPTCRRYNTDVAFSPIKELMDMGGRHHVGRGSVDQSSLEPCIQAFITEQVSELGISLRADFAKMLEDAIGGSRSLADRKKKKKRLRCKDKGHIGASTKSSIAQVLSGENGEGCTTDAQGIKSKRKRQAVCVNNIDDGFPHQCSHENCNLDKHKDGPYCRAHAMLLS